MNIGWREWVALPDLGIPAIKAKIDTGARSSAIHAFNLDTFDKRGRPWVAFDLHPIQRHAHPSVRCTAPLRGYRDVRSSNGDVEERPLIRTRLALGPYRRWKIDLTLTNRDEMGFRLLLGRRALRRRCVIDPGRSFLQGVPPTGPATPARHEDPI